MKDFYIFFEDSNKTYFFTSNFRRKTLLILHFFIEKLLQTYSFKINISFDEINKQIEFPEYISFTDYLDEILSLKIKIKKNSHLYSDIINCFNIISDYSYSNNILTVTFTENFIKLLRNNFIASNFSIDSILLLSNKYSIKLFTFLVTALNLSSTFEISILDLKILLELEDKYSRDNDFINKILIPTLKEINSILYFKITFEKIKISKKIYKILFQKKSILKDSEINSLSIFMENFSPYIYYSRYTKIKLLSYIKHHSFHELFEYFKEVDTSEKFLLKLSSIKSYNSIFYDDKNDPNIILNESIPISQNNKSYFLTWVINNLLKLEITNNFANISSKLLKSIYFNKYEFIEKNYKITCFLEKEIGYLKIERLNS